MRIVNALFAYHEGEMSLTSMKLREDVVDKGAFWGAISRNIL